VREIRRLHTWVVAGGKRFDKSGPADLDEKHRQPNLL